MWLVMHVMEWGAKGSLLASCCGVAVFVWSFWLRALLASAFEIAHDGLRARAASDSQEQSIIGLDFKRVHLLVDGHLATGFRVRVCWCGLGCGLGCERVCVCVCWVVRVGGWTWA